MMTAVLRPWNGSPPYDVAGSFTDIRSKGLHSLSVAEQNAHGLKKTITMSLAETTDDVESATTLINRMYAWRGYGSNHHIGMSPTETTFIASMDSDIVGTLTLSSDTNEGLGIDKTFREELQGFRKVPGSSLCELKRFAFNADAPSKNLLAAFFHTVFIVGFHRYSSTDLFIEVNPRHCKFYEAMLGFKRVGELKTNASVNAPSQLMWLKVSEIRRLVDQHTRNRRAAVRSLYPYFLSATEERRVYARLTQLDEEEATQNVTGKLKSKRWTAGGPPWSRTDQPGATELFSAH